VQTGMSVRGDVILLKLLFIVLSTHGRVSPGRAIRATRANLGRRSRSRNVSDSLGPEGEDTRTMVLLTTEIGAMSRESSESPPTLPPRSEMHVTPSHVSNC
jgi:hypothetical protein